MASQPPPVTGEKGLLQISDLSVVVHKQIDGPEKIVESHQKEDGLGSNSDSLVLGKSILGVGESQEATSEASRGTSHVTKKSWLQAAQKRSFTKQKFEVVEVDGQEKVVVPKEVFLGAKPLWEDFLVGNILNSKAPHVGKIHMIVNKIWRLGDKSTLIDVLEVNESTVKFRVRNEAMRHRILNRRMWNIMGLPMIISKWTPYSEDVQPALKSIPLWVTLSNVPLTMFTDKGLEFLASVVGKPVRLHPKTEACESFEEAKILVEADLTKDLPKEYILSGEEEGELDAVIHYSYPWLSPHCQVCKKWGHLRDSCLLEKQKPTSTLNNSPVSEKEPQKIVVEEAHVSTKVVEELFNNLPSQSGVSVALETKVQSNTKTDQGWISPLKTTKSPMKNSEVLKFGEVSLLSNPYAPLSVQEDIREDEIVVTTTSEINVVGQSMVTEKAVETDFQTSDISGVGGRNRCPKSSHPTRKQQPRGSKTAHKVIPQGNTHLKKEPVRDQGNKIPPHHH